LSMGLKPTKRRMVNENGLDSISVTPGVGKFIYPIIDIYAVHMY